MKNLLILLSILSILSLAACTQSKSSSQTSHDAESQNNLAGTSWELERFAQSQITNTEVRPTLTFEEMKGEELSFSGKNFVNQYGGVFTLAGKKLTKKGGISATEMASTDSTLNKLEFAYFQALDKVSAFELKGEELILALDAPDNYLVFKLKK